jgi:hypothetical protein
LGAGCAKLTLEGKSPETILWYRKKLTRFATFMQDGGAPAKVRSLTLDDGRSFIKPLMELTTRYTNHCLRHEEQGGLAPQSIHGYVRALRAFTCDYKKRNTKLDFIHLR